MTERICCRCHQSKPDSAFYKTPTTPDGLHKHCIQCGRDSCKRGHEKRKARATGALPPKPVYTPEEYKEKRRQDKRDAYAADPEKHKEKAKSNRVKFADYFREYFKQRKIDNPELMRKYAIDAYYRNKPTRGPANAAQASKRYAFKLNAIPAWADASAIKAIYRKVAKTTRDTGITHHVDHIIPLLGKTVCGLHVENNLQIITATENRKKGNRSWPDMP